MSIVDAARAMLGTRWKHQGRAPGAGLDCIGLVGMAALACGVPGAREWYDEQELHRYAPSPDPKMLVAGCDRFMDRIPFAQATIGDVLVMAFYRDPQHFALISRTDPMYLIHAYTAVRKVVENGLNVAGARIIRAYRFRDIEA